MIAKRKEDYRIYVEDNNKNYLSTDFIIKSTERLDKCIDVTFSLKNEQKSLQDKEFTLHLSIEEIVAMTNLLNECVKLL